MDEVDLLDEGQRTRGRRTRVDSDCDVVAIGLPVRTYGFDTIPELRRPLAVSWLARRLPAASLGAE